MGGGGGITDEDRTQMVILNCNLMRNGVIMGGGVGWENVLLFTCSGNHAFIKCLIIIIEYEAMPKNLHVYLSRRPDHQCHSITLM